MNLWQQLKSLDKSAVALQTAKSFLFGYGSAVAVMVYPAATDFTAFIKTVGTPTWWLGFFGCGMTGAISFTFGQKLKSLFDAKSTSPQIIDARNLPPS